MKNRSLITGGYVATMDDSIDDIPNGAVLVENGVIKAVAPAAQLASVDAEVIDAEGGVILPGMVDSHRHTCSSLLRGIGADASLMEFLSNAFTRILPATNVEDLYTSSFVGALEALDSGVTTILDCCEACSTRAYAEANMQALIDSGIRGFFSYGMNSEDYPGVGTGLAAHEARMLDAVRLQDAETDLIRLAIGISHPGTGPFDRMAAEIRLAAEREMLCCSHSAALKNSIYMKGIRERADHDLMLPGHVYIHCTNVTDQEWQLIAHTGGKVSIAPETEMQMGMGLPPIRACIEHGINVALSTDTVNVGSPDLFSQMRLGLQMQRCLDNEAAHSKGTIPMRVCLSVRDALTWGTRNSADALGLGGEVGTLTPLKKADIVVISSKRTLAPSSHPLGTTVLQSTGADVDTVMVGGRVRKRHGQLVGHDLAAIRARAKAAFDRINEGMSTMPPPMSEAQLMEYLATSERVATINFGGAYTSGLSTVRRA